MPCIFVLYIRTKRRIRVVKRFGLFIVFFLLCGFSAQAKSFKFELGTYGIHTVSEAVRFVTGNQTMWRLPEVKIYNPTSGKVYNKSRWQMRHLPTGTIVSVDDSLVAETRLDLHTPKTISDICLNVLIYRCKERIEFFNPGISQPTSTIYAPAFAAVKIPNPITPVPVPQVTAPQNFPFDVILEDKLFKEWRRETIIHNSLLLVIIIVLIFIFFANRPVYETRGSFIHEYVEPPREKNFWERFRTWRSQKSDQEVVGSGILGQTGPWPTTVAPPFPDEAEPVRERDDVRKFKPAILKAPKEEKIRKLELALSKRFEGFYIDGSAWPTVDIIINGPGTELGQIEDDNKIKHVIHEIGILLESEFSTKKVVKDTEKQTLSRVYSIVFKVPN